MKQIPSVLALGLFAVLSSSAQATPPSFIDNEVTFASGSATIGQSETTQSRLTIAQVVEPNLVAPAIPEPETYALMLAGLGGLAVLVRKRRSRQ